MLISVLIIVQAIAYFLEVLDRKKKKKTGWGANLKERSRVFKEGQEKHKALDIKEGKKKKYIKIR